MLFTKAHHRAVASVGVVGLAYVLASVVPASASAEPATEYSAAVSGTVGIQVNSSEPQDGAGAAAAWTLNATFPLAGSVPYSGEPAYGVWVPTSGGAAFSADLGGNEPSYYLGDIPGSSLSQTGYSNEDPGPTPVDWSCPGSGTEPIYDELIPDLEEYDSGSAIAFRLSFSGQLVPSDNGGSGDQIDCNPQGPAGDGDGGEFEINTPNSAGEPSQATTLQFGFGGVTSAASQTLTGTSESALPTDLSTTMGCIQDPPLATCSSSFTQAAATLTLTKICSGTINVSGGQLTQYSCGSSPPTSSHCVVPNVKGKTKAKAEKAITKADCKVGKVTKKHSKKVAKGKVISQSVKAGKKEPVGTKVKLVVSSGKAK